MISGLGFSEILLVGLIVILFFGSEDLPKLLRQVGEFWGKLKKFTNAAKAEIDSVVKEATPDLSGVIDDTILDEKKEVREEVQRLVKSLDADKKEKESADITSQILSSEEWKSASSVLLFVSQEDDPDMKKLIKIALEEKKRVVLPYRKESTQTLGIAEITNLDEDLITGESGVLEPKKELHDNFFLSDIRLILCPGVAFSRDRYRLGCETGYYDSFLGSLTGKIPVWGVCFHCQIKENLPFDYNNILMDSVITPNEIIGNS